MISDFGVTSVIPGFPKLVVNPSKVIKIFDSFTSVLFLKNDLDLLHHW
jgi:hypothetical protein